MSELIATSSGEIRARDALLGYWWYEKSEADKEIAELKAALESEKASRYADSVDAGMQERRLKHALWLARAERAKDRKYKYETWERNELKKFNWDGDLIAIVSMKARKWRRVEIKCIKKAEEYTDEQT